MYTMLTCPICHRMFETAVTECSKNVGGCGHVVPQAAPAVPAKTDEAAHTAALPVHATQAVAPAPVLTVAEASEAASAAIDALHVPHG